MTDSESPEKLQAKLDSLDKKLDEAQEERKLSKILMAVFTAVLGFGVWMAQSRVQQHIDDKSKELATNLALKQLVYGRELDRYESVHEQMAVLIGALGEVQADPSQKKAADDAINKLYVTYTTDSLYLSNEVISKLKALVTSAGNLPSLVSSNSTAGQSVDALQAVDSQIIAIESQMKQDLQLTQLGQIPGVKTAVKSASNP